MKHILLFFDLIDIYIRKKYFNLMVLFKELEVCSDTISTFLKEMNIFCNLEGFDKEYTFVSHFELFDCMNE